MKFTKHKSKFVENYFEEKVQIVINVIRSRIPDVISIIMGGGFGREEGSVYVKGKTVYPINDFDMYVITRKSYDENFINDVAEEATKKIGKEIHPSLTIFNKYDFKPFTEFFYVDLKAIPISKLKNLPPMSRYYELKNASRIMYGDSNILDKIPNIKVEDIPLGEGIRMLMNRMSHMVQFFYPNFLKRKYVAVEHEMLLIHSIKTYLSGAVSLLFLTKDYKPTYKECVENLEKHFDSKFYELKNIIPDYPKQVRKFLKLKYDTNLMSYKEKELELWDMSRKYLGVVSKYYLSKFLNKDIKNWNDFSEKLLNKSHALYYGPYISFFLKRKFGIKIKNKLFLKFLSIFAQMYLNFIYFIRIKKNYNKYYFRSLLKFRSPELTFFSALPLILYSLDTDGNVNMKMLEKGKKILAKTYPVDIKRYNCGSNFEYWEKIADRYSKAYMLFAFLRIV